MDSNALAPEDMRKRRQEAQEKVPRVQGSEILLGCRYELKFMLLCVRLGTPDPSTFHRSKLLKLLML
jgi:hypothetical protein